MIKEGDFIIAKPSRHIQYWSHDIPKGPQQIKFIYGVLVSLNNIPGFFEFDRFDKFEWFEKGDK